MTPENQKIRKLNEQACILSIITQLKFEKETKVQFIEEL